MNMKSVLEKCREEGYPVSANSIYVAGVKYGFLNKNEDNFHFDFDKDKFLEWLNKAKQEIPEGWKTLKQASIDLDVSIPQMYLLIKLPEVESKNFGSGRGVTYVHVESVRKYLDERNKINWEENSNE